MFQHLRHFFLSQKLFFALSAFLAVYLIVFFLEHFINNPVLAFFQIIGGFFWLILGTGLSLVLILQWLIKKSFDWWEFLSLAFLGGILIAPAILVIEFIFFGKAYDWYPVANILILWIGAGLLLFYKKTSLLVLPSFSRTIFQHPLFLVLTAGIALVLLQILSYRALPDLDPYKWLMKYAYQFANQLLDINERPFFGAFTFIGMRLTGLDIFPFFKYILPFLFLTALFPAWLVARTFAKKTKQWLFLLFFFVSPVVLLYIATPMPQSPMIVLAYFFLFFLLYAAEKPDDFWLYGAGAAIFLAFFYHQAAIIMFFVWLTTVTFAKRKLIFSDKKTSLLLGLLIATNAVFFEKMWQFLSTWSNNILPHFFAPNNLNLLYPAYYLNTDRFSMGWGSLGGVLKFYAFHMGPLLGSILALFLGLLIFNKNFRSFCRIKTFSSPALFIAVSIFLLFFTIAEIFPRFPNIALLPDRAWIFCGVFSFVFLFLILRFLKNIPRWAVAVFILFLTIGLSGTLYINYLKRYLITPAQWESARWIETKLPLNRIFFSAGHKNLLPVHANTPLLKIPAEIYCSSQLQDFENIVSQGDFNELPKAPLKDHLQFLENIKETLRQNIRSYYKKDGTFPKEYAPIVYQNNDLLHELADFQNMLQKKEGIAIIYPPSQPSVFSDFIPIQDIYNFNRLLSLKGHPLYVFYSREHPQNPYANRPYEMSTWGIQPCPDGKFLFDLYPDKFKRVYSAPDEEAIIWQIL